MNLVSELQASIARDDVLTLLRNARMLATKLGRTDIDNWLHREREGYGENDEVPDYRRIAGPVIFQTIGAVRVGRQVIQGRDEVPGHPVVGRQVVDSLRDIAGRADAQAGQDELCFLPIHERDIVADLRQFLNPVLAPYVTFMVRVSPLQFRSIIEAVRDRIADWTCELVRQGVRGENNDVTDNERERAAGITFEAPNANFHFYGAPMNDNSIRNSGNLSVGRDLVQARDITRSFNALAEKTEKPEVADKLRQLALSLNDILAGLQGEQAEQVERDAEAFAKEAAAKSPRKEILEMFGTALTGTLKAVGTALAPTATALITAVIAAALA